MSTAHVLKMVPAMALALLLASAPSLARRGGGGGGGGGRAVHSAPSVSRPSASRPSAPPRAPAPARPPAAARPVTTPAAARPVQRPAAAARPPASAAQRPAAVAQRPAAVAQRPAAPVPAVAARSTAARSGYAGSTRRVTPPSYGSVSRPGAAAGLAVAGGAVAASGLRGGDRDMQTGQTPGGRDYVAIDGPRGEFGAIQGPGGGVAAGARGSGGGTASAVRGPRGNWVVDRVPDGSVDVIWGGHRYRRHGVYWYAPYWDDDEYYYEYQYPPLGYWYEELPANCETVVVDQATYYLYDSMYYQDAVQGGREGYKAVAPPATNSAGQALAVLQATCDFLGSLDSFEAEIEVTMEQYLETGDKVPVEGRAVIHVQQPDRMEVDRRIASENRRYEYDGKMLEITDRTSGQSIGLPVPSRIEDLIPYLREQRGVHLPLGDLLQRDAFDVLSLSLDDAEYIGVKSVGGVACHHVAFSQAEIDWEMWVPTGAEPLPARMYVVYKASPQAPRYKWISRAWRIDAGRPAGSGGASTTAIAAPPVE